MATILSGEWQQPFKGIYNAAINSGTDVSFHLVNKLAIVLLVRGILFDYWPVLFGVLSLSSFSFLNYLPAPAAY
jgi:hypothetical protein